MGTTVKIKVKENFNAIEIINDAIETMEQISDVFDLYKTSTELSKINQNTKKQSVSVSNEFRDLLKTSFEINKKTLGAFDITIGPLEDLWGFYETKTNTIPDKEQIERTLEQCGMQNLQIKGNNIIFSDSNMQLDFNALAKGYAVDKAVNVLRQKGVTQAIVNAGGDVFCLGDNKGKGWRVGIRDPRKKKSIVGFITIDNRAVATSGGYENFVTIKDNVYPHILDPRTGYPVESNILSSTVIAFKGAVADALATAFFVLSVEQSLSIVEDDPLLECVLIAKDNGQLKYYVSSGMKNNFELIDN